MRIIRSRREVTNTCSAWCHYSSRAHGRHWQSLTTFYQWGQSQAQNSLTYSSRQPLPTGACSWHKLGTQEVLSVITPWDPQNVGYNWKNAEIVLPILAKYKWKSLYLQCVRGLPCLRPLKVCHETETQTCYKGYLPYVVTSLMSYK